MSLGYSTTNRNANNELSDLFGTNGALGYTSSAASNATNSMLNSSQTALSQLYPQLQAAQNAGTTSARAATLSDLNSMGADYVKSLTGSSPLLSAAQSKLTNMVGTADQQSDLSKTLTSQALENLKLGSSLSDEQVRDATQGTRSGLASRGMAMGNNAIGAEILSRDSYGQGLQTQRQNTALNVENQNQSEKTAAQNFVLGANNAGQTLTNSALGLMNGTTGVNVNGLTNFVNPTAAVSAGTSATNSILGYGSDVNSSNYNAAIDAARTKSNNYSALLGSILGAGGKIGGSILGSYAGTSSSSLGPYASLLASGGDGRP